MLKRLAAEGLVQQKRYRGIFLTEEGAGLAAMCRDRHQVVESFLRALGISPERHGSIRKESNITSALKRWMRSGALQRGSQSVTIDSGLRPLEEIFQYAMPIIDDGYDSGIYRIYRNRSRVEVDHQAVLRGSRCLRSAGKGCLAIANFRRHRSLTAFGKTRSVEGAVRLAADNDLQIDA
jgi:hypothetical protein